MTAIPITVTGLPAACKHCGHKPEGWPLSAHALQVILVCPECHSRIGHLVAVPPDGSLQYEADTASALAALREQDALDYPHDEPCPRCGRRQWGGPDPYVDCQACGYHWED